MTREEAIEKATEEINKAATFSNPNSGQWHLDIADRWLRLAIEGFPVDAPVMIGN